MGVSDEDEREEGKPGEGVRGVAGEGGKDDGLEFVSSVELSDSLRKWVYLVFGTSSIMNLQCQFLYPCKSTQALVIQSKSLCLSIQSFSLNGHAAICLSLSVQELYPSAWLSVLH